MNYEKWPTKYLSPLYLLLDHHNPRLPGLYGKSVKQNNIREEIFKIGQIQNLIKSIATSGYFPDQLIVIVQEGTSRKYTVVEGNRRVCACQALLNPNQVPIKYIKLIKRWQEKSEETISSFQKIKAILAPTRADATRLIVSRHLQDPVMRWSVYAQGKFAVNALNDGLGIAFIKEQTNLSQTRINQLIRYNRLIDILLELDWNEQEKEELMNHLDTFPIDAIMRLIRNPITQKRTGKVLFDIDGWPEFYWDIEQFAPFLKQLVRDAIPKVGNQQETILNTRIANDEKSIEGYLNKFPEKLIPNPSNNPILGKDTVIQNEPIVSSTPSAPSTTPAKKKVPKTTLPKTALPPDIECNIDHIKAKKLLEELQSINPDIYPHGTAMLLRMLVEIALYARIRKTNSMSELKSKSKTNQNNWLPSLAQMIDFSHTSEKIITDHALRNSIKDPNIFPKYFLNLVAHNDQHIVIPEDVRNIAKKMENFLRFLMNPESSDHATLI